MKTPKALPGDRITVVQGMTYVTAAPVILSTVLGSCVACCLYDATAHVGGMNHFLLAEPHRGITCDQGEGERYGVFAMELLVNEMLKAGAVRDRLRAHLYGGANLHAGMQAIGTTNASFARGFLERDRIPLIHSDLGGTCARRVDFRASLGQARCRVIENEVAIQPVRAMPRQEIGNVELF